MRIIVTGGRDLADAKLVHDYLDRLLDSLPLRDLIVIQGKCETGADKYARDWCTARGVPFISYPYAKEYGRAGGPVRNQRMVDGGRADLVVAFPGGRGTADMVQRARKADIPVVEIALNGTEFVASVLQHQ